MKYFRLPILLILALSVVQHAVAGMVGVITDISVSSREVVIDDTRYRLAPGLRVIRDGNNQTFDPRQLYRGAGIFFEADGRMVHTIRLLDKPVRN